VYTRHSFRPFGEHGETWQHSNRVARRQPEQTAPTYRTAPHNIEAEQALLGAILVNN